MQKLDEIGQMLVSGALDDTNTIGKVGADIFANFGLANLKKTEQIKQFSAVFPNCPNFPMDLA